MKKIKIILIIYIFSLLIAYPYKIDAYEEPNDDITKDNEVKYRSIDELLKELKEERKLINQQKLDEINQKKLEKQNQDGGVSEETPVPETPKPKKDSENEYIPKLIVRLRGKHSPKYLCSYELLITDDTKEIELSKDIISNYSLLMKKPSLKVRPGEVINFEFVPNCKSLNAYIWEEENDSLKEIKAKRGCIEVPNIDKKIVVIIQGNFSNGYIKYGIVLDIRK
ncbi:Uncharacterised protein [uncultured Clostridium sp.]|uniref:hypothetical protein n=1 Tax=uncultured Clostridium sp. TaxID=59620 RepID=UPI000820D744|nr:hypothetical protein [uncultured Clostridium sp.]SCK04370.1 Uncharacterised protein [uncultured Clostridium sp.]